MSKPAEKMENQLLAEVAKKEASIRMLCMHA
jgi:hypothetical protein